MTVRIKKGRTRYIDVEICYLIEDRIFQAEIQGFFWQMPIGVPLPVGRGETIDGAFHQLKERLGV